MLVITLYQLIKPRFSCNIRESTGTVSSLPFFSLSMPGNVVSFCLFCQVGFQLQNLCLSGRPLQARSTAMLQVPHGQPAQVCCR